MLFLVQDSDRPMYVEADNYQHAVDRWKAHLAPENECSPEEIENPNGVQHVADDNDFLPLEAVATNITVVDTDLQAHCDHIVSSTRSYFGQVTTILFSYCPLCGKDLK